MMRDRKKNGRGWVKDLRRRGGMGIVLWERGGMETNGCPRAALTDTPVSPGKQTPHGLEVTADYKFLISWH